MQTFYFQPIYFYMKTVFCGIVLFLSLIGINAQPKFSIKAEVNQQVELLSIVARLAEYDEYVNNNFKVYADEVDKHFGSYKNHELIEFAKKIREKNGIGFDRVMAMAAHLNQNFTPKVPFTETVPNKNWGKKDAENFARLIQKFYKDAECEKFFKAHAAMYQLAEQRYQKIVDDIDIPWFEKFYGERPKGKFNVYVGLLLGGGNFGAKVIYPKGKQDIFAIMGVTAADEKGIPVFSAEAETPVIIHEFNHSFVNHLVDENPKPFEESCSKIYKFVAENMRRQAYGGWQTPLNESLVRAGVIRYLTEHKGIEVANTEIIGEQGNGFVWMDELVVLLGTYENTRKFYPTLRSFMPVLAGYHVDLAKRVENKIKKFEALKPKITAIDVFKNEAQDVDPNIKLITFTFNRALRGVGISINYGKLGAEAFPELEKGFGYYNEDATKFTLKVKLKPDWNYEFVMSGEAFISKDGYPLQEYVVKFKTKKE